MTTPRNEIEAVAEAVKAALVSCGLDKDGYTLGDLFDIAEVAAQAAIDALRLSPEWAAVTDIDVYDGVLAHDSSTDDYQHALEWVQERCKTCDHCRNARPKFIAQRLVGPWVRQGQP